MDDVVKTMLEEKCSNCFPFPGKLIEVNEEGCCISCKRKVIRQASSVDQLRDLILELKALIKKLTLIWENSNTNFEPQEIKHLPCDACEDNEDAI